MSAEEASKVIGKSRRATESLLFRAKSALKTQLEKDGFVYEDT
jgi:RNA polymerase sigma-70 factor (ECF subfamily)